MGTSFEKTLFFILLESSVRHIHIQILLKSYLQKICSSVNIWAVILF